MKGFIYLPFAYKKKQMYSSSLGEDRRDMRIFFLTTFVRDYIQGLFGGHYI